MTFRPIATNVGGAGRIVMRTYSHTTPALQSREGYSHHRFSICSRISFKIVHRSISSLGGSGT